jgi:hypothetical protein
MAKTPKSKGAGPKTPNKKLLGSGSKTKTNAPRGASGSAVQPFAGMNVGGLSDAQARSNVAGTQKMLSNQLKKNKSAGIKP